MRKQTRIPTRETGSALIISILVMFVLTVLGMALMLTTSTEADIATNYRWGEMAFFNADAALEYAKNVLANQQEPAPKSFEKYLPAARTPAQMNDKPGLASGQVAYSRDFQYSIDQGGVKVYKVYIGKVLVDTRRGKPLQFDYRQPTAGLAGGELFGNQQDIQGTATIWVRRPIVGPTLAELAVDPDQSPRDDKSNDRVIITAEGTAPNFESQATGRPGATRRLEMTIRLLADAALDYGHGPATGGSDTETGGGGSNWSSGQTVATPKD